MFMDRRFYMMCAAVLLVVVAAWSPALSATQKYIGVHNCSAQRCHGGAAQGNQFGIWQGSAHADAYKVLATDQSKEVAAKAGVDGDPQKSPKCLKCHVTAYGVSKKLISAGFKIEDGVQCESCHGAGSGYRALMLKDTAKFRADTKGQYNSFVKAGGVIPTEKECVECHNPESPTYKQFVFIDSLKKIAHPAPVR